MRNDATLTVAKYPDEIWNIAIDWSSALDGSDIVGTPMAVGVGVTVDQVQQLGPTTHVTVSGGGPNHDFSARIEILVQTTCSERLGFNLGIPVRPR